MANLPAPLEPTSLGEMMHFADVLSKSTMIPTAFQRNPANIMVAWQWGRELGLNLMQSLQSIAVINGRPAVYGDAMLALVRASPLCEDVIERIERDGDNRIAVCEARRKGSAPVFGRFSILDARRAGLWEKVGPWKQYPARMLQMRARGFALRDAFPDVLRGVISGEEAEDVPRETKDVTPTVLPELDAFAEAQEEDAPGNHALRERLAEAPTVARARRMVPDEPTDAAIERLAEPGMHEAVLGPERSSHAANAEEIAKLDPAKDSADLAAPPDSPPEEMTAHTAHPPEGDTPEEEDIAIPLILPARGRRGYNWSGFADELIEASRQLAPADMGRFRVKNAQQMQSLRVALKDEWSRMQQALAEYEREGK